MGTLFGFSNSSIGPVESNISNMVDTQIGKTTQWADDMLTTANNHINMLAALRYDIDYDKPIIKDSLTPPIFAVQKPSTVRIDDIEIESVAFTGITPNIPTFDWVNYEAPIYTDKDYGINIPDAPIVTWPQFSKEAPVVPDRSLPTTPTVDLPVIPTLTDITIPDPPSYSNPEFTADVPVEDLSLPSINFTWGESVYNSNLKTKLGDVLFDNLVNGGTGLNEVTEQAIYSRATSRMEIEEQKFIDDISDNIAERGFDIPPGALYALKNDAEAKILRSKEDLNNDILINQSKLAQENTHFIMQQVTNLETVLINYHNSTQERAIEAAKFTITSTIQVHTLKLENYKAKLQAYQTLAQVYQIRVQAEIAKAEFYKAQIEAVKSSVDVQKLYIQAYLGQIEAVKASLETYRLQMEGARVAAEIDKLKLDSYATEVNAYGVKVSAAAQMFEGYKAQLSGEALKSEIKKTDVQTFVAQTEAYKTKTQAEVAKAETQLNYTRIEAAVYEQAIAKYTADVNKAVAEAETKAKLAGLDVTVFSALSNNYNAEVSAAVNVFNGQINELRTNADLSLKAADIAVQTVLSEYELTLETAKGVATVSGQLAAAAAGAVNASVTGNASASASNSYSGSQSEIMSSSNSQSESTITEHIYTYSN